MSDHVEIKRLPHCFGPSTRYIKRYSMLLWMATLPPKKAILTKNDSPDLYEYDHLMEPLTNNTITEEQLDEVIRIKKIKLEDRKIFDTFKEISVPSRATDGAAGYDLQAAIDETIEITPGETKLIPTGLSVSMPKNLEIQVRPRSGLAAKHSITVLNTPGTIDSDYGGEIKVILINHGKEVFKINRGDRIAQAIFNKIEHPKLIEVESLEKTTRGCGGFGSTGVE